MKTELTRAIDHLYEVFGDYYFDSTDFKNNSCPCCYDRKVGVLASKPLQSLTSDDLTCYQISSIYTIGNIAHYKHFLPRILELIAQPNNDLISDFLISDKLTYAEWETWPIEEINAIEAYFEILCKNFVFDDTTDENYFNDVLQFMARYELFTKFLKKWLTATSPTSCEYIISGVLYGFPFKITDAQYNIIIDHLSSDEILEKLETVYFNTKDPIKASTISVVYTILENKQKITFY